MATRGARAAAGKSAPRWSLRRLAILANAGSTEAIAEVTDVEGTAGKLGLAVTKLGITRGDDIPLAFDGVKDKADALYVVGEGLVAANRLRIITHALGARLPAIYNNREYVEVGGLMSYGPNYPDLFRRARRVCRQDPARHQARRLGSRAANPVRFGAQPDDRQGARH
jgi:ABC-type uncharacterized transport system substrate-binding protein